MTTGIAAHIIDKIENVDRYVGLNSNFVKAFAFLKRSDLNALPVGRYEIDGENCWAMVQEVELHPHVGAKVEYHRRYVDIQAPLSDAEAMGLCTLTDEQLAGAFDAERDCAIFDSASQPVVLQPGEFAIFFPPRGGHAPCCTLGQPKKIKKLVIKVRAE